MPEQEHKLLRQSEFDKMCKIEQQFYMGCVVPDDFDEYKDIPETLQKIFLYKFWSSVEKNVLKRISELNIHSK